MAEVIIKTTPDAGEKEAFSATLETKANELGNLYTTLSAGSSEAKTKVIDFQQEVFTFLNESYITKKSLFTQKKRDDIFLALTIDIKNPETRAGIRIGSLRDAISIVKADLKENPPIPRAEVGKILGLKNMEEGNYEEVYATFTSDKHTPTILKKMLRGLESLLKDVNDETITTFINRIIEDINKALEPKNLREEMGKILGLKGMEEENYVEVYESSFVFEDHESPELKTMLIQLRELKKITKNGPVVVFINRVCEEIDEYLGPDLPQSGGTRDRGPKPNWVKPGGVRDLDDGVF